MLVIGRIQGENWLKLQQEEIDPDSVLASLAIPVYLYITFLHISFVFIMFRSLL